MTNLAGTGIIGDANKAGSQVAPDVDSCREQLSASRSLPFSEVFDMAKLDRPFFPLDVNLLEHLPKDRAYSLIEATFHYQSWLALPASNRPIRAISYWAKCWSWSRHKVRDFIATGEGQVKDTSRTDKGHINFNFVSTLPDASDGSRTVEGHSADSKRTQVIDVDLDKEKKKTKTIVPNIVLPDWLSEELWEAFKDMRRSIKKPITPYAQKLTIATLTGFHNRGLDANLALEISIQNSWKGVFEPKGNAVNPTPPVPGKLSQAEIDDHARQLREAEERGRARIAHLPTTFSVKNVK